VCLSRFFKVHCSTTVQLIKFKFGMMLFDAVKFSIYVKICMIQHRFWGTVRAPPNSDPKYEISRFWRFSLRSFVKLFQHCPPLRIEDRFYFIGGSISAVDSGIKPISMVCDDFSMVPLQSCSNINVDLCWILRIGLCVVGLRIILPIWVGMSSFYYRQSFDQNISWDHNFFECARGHNFFIRKICYKKNYQ
jgi:hypothetical protein